ncbi:hypothetical protein [uncultured Phocaeicola sp.]|uniref:hypothetical protein n=1 Tax=uncultured Phocaeicola sp. TaxID=990718 RepID=UPI0030C710B4
MHNEEIIVQLKKNGFEGFLSIADLRIDKKVIPQMPGVYMVVRISGLEPQFLKVGTGGFFKGKNPNVQIEELEKNWVEDESLLYIGKATDLRKRLGAYLNFGQCKNVGHWGGRFIWQLADSDKLIICWKVLSEVEPRKYEQSFLYEFYKVNGKYPFANLKG